MSEHVIFITGSAIGIGRELAISFAREGSTVIALDIDETENEQTRLAVVEAGGTCHAYDCDIGDKAAVRAVFDDLKGTIDHIDLLVNNAALFNDTTLLGGDWQHQTSEFDKAMDVGVMGAFYCTAAAAPLLAKAGQSNIINMLTNHVRKGYFMTGSVATGYDCAKFALLRLTQNWSVELKDQGTRVNGLCFGATHTPMLRKWGPEHMAAMTVGDIDQALRNVIDQGPDGSSGRSYNFGMEFDPTQTCAAEIAAIRTNEKR